MKASEGKAGSIARFPSSHVVLHRALVVGAVLLLIAPVLSNTDALATCSGKAIRPGDSIASVINNAPSGTTFCIAPGTYKPGATIKPKDYDHLSGTGTTRDAVLITTDNLQLIIDAGNSRGVVYTNLAVSGAINRCPGSNCGATGDGIHGGVNVTATNVHVYGNGRTAFSAMDGLTLSGSRLDHNGAVYKGNMDGVSAGVKSAAALTIKNSVIDHNYGNGAWCDMQCGTFTIENSQVTYNVSTGIHDEISQGPALIANNVVQHNDLANEAGHGGIGIIDSKNVQVYGNTLGGNIGTGISARYDKRTGCGTPTYLCGYALSNISIHNNHLNGDVLFGCGNAGVQCSTNYP
jgi:Right handed beta helix region